jgi:Mg2+-importing ATPase
VLPFLPMTPGQILLNNLIYDASQTAIPSDNVDADVEAEPARWDVHAIERFMVVFGPISSIFDYVTFGLLLLMLGNNEDSFHTGWFVESLFTQILVVLVIRTPQPVLAEPAQQAARRGDRGGAGVAVIIPLSPLGSVIGFGALPWQFWLRGRPGGLVRRPSSSDARRIVKRHLRPARGAAARRDRRQPTLPRPW